MAKDSYRGLSYNADKLPCGCCRCCGCSCRSLLTIPCDLCDASMVSGEDVVQIHTGKLADADDDRRRLFDGSKGRARIICMPCADKCLRALFRTDDDI